MKWSKTRHGSNMQRNQRMLPILIQTRQSNCKSQSAKHPNNFCAKHLHYKDKTQSTTIATETFRSFSGAKSPDKNKQNLLLANKSI